MTRQQIESQLRLDNPTTTDETGQEHGPGSIYYESMIEVWADNMEASLTKDPPPPPTEHLVVTKRQLLLALYMEHQILESDIEAALQENTLALIDFKSSTQIERAYPLVDQLGYIFNLDKKDIDNVFQIAYNIQNPYSNEQPDQS